MRLGYTLLAAALLTTPAWAQTGAQTGAQTADPHAGMKMGAQAGADSSMMESMNKMNQAMSSAPMNGDPDHDFVSMMIPHHQGAVDMANYELQHGKDPGLRKLAKEIVAAQDKEIAEMKRWLAKHPAK